MNEQPPQKMGGNSMERGPGPQGRGPVYGDKTAPKKMQLPDEAYSICRDMQPGDKVQITQINGERVLATCTVVDEHLVAVPAEKNENLPPR